MIQFTKWFKIIVGLMELGLAIPILGGLFVMMNGYLPLTIMFILHVAGFILGMMSKQSKSGHVLGMIGNLIAIIPIVGMISHAIVGIVVLLQGFKTKENPQVL